MVIVTALYIPPQSDTTSALKELYWTLCKLETATILLIPSYRQKLEQEVPMLRSIQCWSDQSESMLQDCFDHADWDMFRVASKNIDEHTDTVTEFIRKCMGDVVPTVTIKTYPNQKLWIDGSIRAKLKE